MKGRVVATSRAPAAIGPYSQAVLTPQGFLYTAGQIPINPATGTVVAGDITPQTQQVLENVRAILEAAGTGLHNVVKTTVFLKDMNDFAAMNAVYGQYFKENPPARSTIEVCRLPKDVLVEIEAVALVNPS